MKLLRKLAEMVRDQRGVTLIELLAVIVILGIIAAIGIPALMDSREKAQQETFNTNAQIMTEAAKRKMLMGEKYTNEVEEPEKEFNLGELLEEANIASGEPSEVDGESTDEEDLGTATAFVDENDESKGTYELNVADGTVVYNPEGGTEEEADADSDEAESQDFSDDGQPLDVEREPVTQ